MSKTARVSERRPETGPSLAERIEINLADDARLWASPKSAKRSPSLAPIGAQESASSGQGSIVDFTVRIAMASAMAAPTPSSENG